MPAEPETSSLLELPREVLVQIAIRTDVFDLKLGPIG